VLYITPRPNHTSKHWYTVPLRSL